MQFDKMNSIELADKILPFFNDHDMTNIYGPFIKAGMVEEEIEEGNHARLIHDTVKVLEDSLGYIEQTGNSGRWYLLTDLGREVKSAGGHFAYRNRLEAKVTADKARQERKDKADELDLQIKTWQVKTKYLPYIVSILALGVSICSYFKPDKKQQDLQPMQQQIQQLQDHVKSLDSLLQSDSLLRKHK